MSGSKLYHSSVIVMYSLVFSVSFSDAFNTQWAQIMRYSLTIWTRASCSANNPWDGLLTSHQGDIYMMLRHQKGVGRLTERKVIPSAKMVPMSLDSMLCFSGHLEPSSIDARARQSFSFSSQNWPHGSRAETRRENDAKSRYEV